MLHDREIVNHPYHRSKTSNNFLLPIMIFEIYATIHFVSLCSVCSQLGVKTAVHVPTTDEMIWKPQAGAKGFCAPLLWSITRFMNQNMKQLGQIVSGHCKIYKSIYNKIIFQNSRWYWRDLTLYLQKMLN